MNLASDTIVDRRRLRRQLTFWRVAAALTALVAIVVAGLLWSGRGLGAARPHIARVSVSGLITGSQTTIDLLRRAGDATTAAAVVVRINSGGGTTAGSEALFNEVRRLAEKKPVVAVIDGVGASGAYMTALGAERIVANGSALVGSIGVIAQMPNVSKLLDTLGVKVESVRSSPLKAMPNGMEPTTPESRAAIEEMVRDSYLWFRDLVGKRRKLEGEALGRVVDGRVFTGRRALELGLVDAIGDEKDAIAWLETEKGIAKGLRVLAYTDQSLTRIPGLTSIVGRVHQLIGIDGDSLAGAARSLIGPDALDGLVSVWHPAKD